MNCQEDAWPLRISKQPPVAAIGPEPERQHLRKGMMRMFDPRVQNSADAMLPYIGLTELSMIVATSQQCISLRCADKSPRAQKSPMSRVGVYEWGKLLKHND